MRELDVFYQTDIGKKRTANEDSVLALKLGQMHVLAVADGLGGHAAGEVASRMALIEIDEFLKANLLPDRDVKDSLKTAVSKANREIHSLSRENPAYAGMGTTLVIAVVMEDGVLIANIGDSRAYLIGKEIRQITRDHSLVEELVGRGTITREEASGHAQKNIVTRTLGAESEVIPDFYEEDLSGEVLLLCSDGLTDSLADQEILETVVTSGKLEEACTRLINLANEKGGKDNISVILAREAK